MIVYIGITLAVAAIVAWSCVDDHKHGTRDLGSADGMFDAVVAVSLCAAAWPIIAIIAVPASIVWGLVSIAAFVVRRLCK